MSGLGRASVCLLLLGACVDAREDGRGVDSGGLPGDDSGDAAPSGEPVDLAAVPLACADPTARERLGPFVRWSSLEWEAQLVDASVTDVEEGGWGVATADFDGDGRLDLFVPNWERSALWLGDAAAGFLPAPSDALPAAQQAGARGSGVVAADVDDDGAVDLFVASGGADQVLLNDGTGRFSAATDRSPAVAEGTEGGYGLALGDVDGDGVLDVIVPELAGYQGAADALPPRLFLGTGDATYVAGDTLLPTREQWGHPFLASLVDADGDDDPDLLLPHDIGPGGTANLYFRNDGGRFVDATEQSALGYATTSMGLGVGDLNGDTVPDFVVTAIDRAWLAMSDGRGSWIEGAAAYGLVYDRDRGQEVGWGAELQDVDNDGDLDLWLGFGTKKGHFEEQPDAMYLWEGGVFADVAPDWGLDDLGESRGGLLVDLDQDGWLDLVVRHLGETPAVWMARCGEAGALEVRLTQPTSNRSAIGARVDVELDGRVLTRWVLAGGHSLSSGLVAPLHFGVGDAAEVDDVRIVWPDGARSALGRTATRQLLTVARRTQP